MTFWDFCDHHIVAVVLVAWFVAWMVVQVASAFRGTR
jgi:hypothetical protein